MKKSTMTKLCDASAYIKTASQFGFDFPSTEEGLEAGCTSLADEGQEEACEVVIGIVGRLDPEDFGNLVDWLFKPGSIDPDSLIPNITKYYASGAEMWLDENRLSLADPIKEEAQGLYKTLLETENSSLKGALKDAIRTKLELLEQLGASVELISGVYEYKE